MKLNMWNIFNLLPFSRMTVQIRDETPAIQYVRLMGPENEFRHNTVYVGAAHPDQPEGGTVAIIHRKDRILVEGESLYDVFNRVATIVDRFSFWERKLISAEQDENGVQLMLDGTQSFLPGGFYALTYGGKTLGLSCSTVSPLRPLWDEFSATKDLTYERMYLFDRYFDYSGFTSGVKLTTARSKDGSFYYTFRSIDSPNHNIGFIVFCTPDPTPPKGMEIIIDTLSEHIIQFFERHVGKINLLSRASEMMQKLLKSAQAGDDVKRFFQEIGWDQNNTFQIIAIDCGVKGKSSDIIKYCRSVFTEPLFCAVDKDLVMMLNLDREKSYDVAMEDFLSIMIDDIACGISNIFHYLYSARAYGEQAAYELRRAEKTAGSYSLAKNHDTDFFKTVLLSAPLCRSYLHRPVVTMSMYDSLNGTEFYATLKSYVMSFFHHSDAARILNIHRNTLLYRLEQMRSIIDFSELDDAMQNYDIKLLERYYVSFFIIDEIHGRPVI